MIGRALRLSVPAALLSYALRTKSLHVAHAEGTNQPDRPRIWNIYKHPAPLVAFAHGEHEKKEEEHHHEHHEHHHEEKHHEPLPDLPEGEIPEGIVGSAKVAVHKSKKRLQWLRFEAPGPVRYVIVGAGGLVGFLIATKVKFLGKLIPITLGLATGYAFCYPDEAKEYGTVGLELGAEYGKEALHFIIELFKEDEE